MVQPIKLAPGAAVPTISSDPRPVKRRAFGADEPFVVGRTSEGRVVVDNRDGSFSTERLATEQVPGVNPGQFTNIPTMFSGRQFSPQLSAHIIAGTGGIDPDTGRRLPGFDTVAEAEAAAQERSAGHTFDNGTPIQPTRVEIDGIGTVEFPAGMTQEQIVNAIETDPSFGQVRETRDQGAFGAAASAAVQGLADVVAGVPKSIDIARSASARTLLTELERIDRGEPVDLGRVGPILSAEILGYQSASPERRAQIRQGLFEELDPTDRPLFQAGEAVSQAARDVAPVSPTRQDDFATKLGSGLGSTGGFILAGLASRALGIPPLPATAGAGAATGATSQFQDAIASGASIEEAQEAAGLGGVVGLSEAVPVVRLLDRIDAGTGGIRRLLTNAIKEGTEEAAQEAFQSISSNLIASDLVEYDPERQTFQGTGEDAAVGFTAGAVFQTILGLVLPGRDRGQSPASPAVEQVQDREDAAAAPQEPLPPEVPPRPPLPPEPSVSPDVSRETPAQEPTPADQAAADLQEVIDRTEQGEDVENVLRDQAKAAAPAGTADKPVQAETAADVDQAAAQAEAPSPKQAEAGNYRKGHLKFKGLDIAIETPRGQERAGVDGNGLPWSNIHPTAHYGYIKRTEGADGDQVDVYLGLDTASDRVFIVDQVDPETGDFDEIKVVFGASSAADAGFVYDAGFSDNSGPSRRAALSEVSLDEFKQWLENGDTGKPFGILPEVHQTRNVRDAGISTLAERQKQVLQPQLPGIPQLRGARDQDAPAVAAELPGVLQGGGEAAVAESNIGPDRQQQRLLSGQRPLGELQTAGSQSAQEPIANLSGQDLATSRVGGEGGAGTIDSALSPGRGDDAGAGNIDAASRGAAASNEQEGVAQQPEVLDLSQSPPADQVSAFERSGISATTVEKPRGARSRSEQGVEADEALPSPERIADMQKRWTDLLGVAFRQGRLGRGKPLGQFDLRQGVIRQQIRNEMDVFSHEVGHAFEQHFKKQGLEQLINRHASEIEPMAYAGVEPDKLRTEGFAEWFRLHLTNPSAAQREAPNFSAAFEAWGTTNQQATDLITETQQAWDAYLKAPSTESIKSTTIRPSQQKGFRSAVREVKEEGIGSFFARRGSRIYTHYVDDVNPIRQAVRQLLAIREKNVGRAVELKAADDAYVMARLAKDAYTAGHMDIMYGIRQPNSITPEGPSLSDGMVKALGDKFTKWDQAILDDFSAYLIARRGVHEWGRFFEGKIRNQPTQQTKGDHEVTISEMEAKYEGFREGADLINEWNKQLWRKKFLSGFLTKKQYETGLEEHPFYVPFRRDVTDRTTVIDKPMGTGVAAARKKFQGSQRDILDPIEVMMQDAYETASMIARNEVVRKLADLADVAGPNSGLVMERIPAAEINVTVVDPKDVLKQMTKSSDWDVLDEMDAANAEAAIGVLDDLDLPMAKIYRAAEINTKGEPIVFVYRKGKRVPYRLGDQELGIEVYNALTGLGAEQASAVTSALAMPATTLRLGITTDPAFFLANLFRDQVAAWVLTDVGFKPGWSAAKGMRSDIKRDDVARIYNSFAGLMGGANVSSLDRARVKRDVQAVRQKGISIRRFATVRGFFELTEISETGTRLGIFQQAFERAKARDLTDVEAAVEAAYIARDYIDFGRHGSKMLWARRLIPFFNASLQGLDKSIRVAGGGGSLFKAVRPWLKFYAQQNGAQVELTAQDKRNLRLAAKAWFKAVIVVGGVGIITSLLYEDDPEYEEISEYLRATHWLFKIGDQWWAAPKPFELAVFSNLFERSFEAIYKGDDEAMARFWRSLLEIMAPPTTVPALSVPIEQFANRRFFDDRPVVPEWLKGKEPWLQFNAYTSEFAIWLANTDLGKMLDLSPAIIDHYITGWGGSWGRTLLKSIDKLAKPESAEQGLADMWIVRRFAREFSRGAVSTQRFWKQMERQGDGLYSKFANYAHLIDNPDKGDAVQYLKTLRPEEQEYAVYRFATTRLRQGKTRDHPMERAVEALRIIGAQRRATRIDKELTQRQKRLLDDNLSKLAVWEARNALIAIKSKGWENKEPQKLQSVLGNIKKLHGSTHKALLDNYAKKRMELGQDPAEIWQKIEPSVRQLADEIIAGKTRQAEKEE